MLDFKSFLSQVEIVSSRQVHWYLPVFYVIIVLDVFKGRLFRLYVIASLRASFLLRCVTHASTIYIYPCSPKHVTGWFFLTIEHSFHTTPRSIYDFSIPV